MLLITKVSLKVALETSLALQVKTGTSSIRPASPTDCSTDSLSKIDFTNTFNKLSESLNNINIILSKVENGEGTLGKFINSEELYQNLSQSSKELEELLSDLKANPSRYVQFSLFGKKQKPYQPKK